MRGTPKTAVFYDGSAGIIPAYAGNTSGYPSARPYARDHPRVCGEHLISCTFPRNASGSSPRMRGTRRFRKASTPNNGIIPAYAGNTPQAERPEPTRRDHPRVCGEHGVVREPICRKTGSSPRMRGTRTPAPAQTEDTGIIPAYAGNTASCRVWSAASRDHPRVCGEHHGRVVKTSPTQGSSPRMRGTQLHGRHPVRMLGIIPAYAGNTVCLPSYSPCLRDHPRVCGEHPGVMAKCDTPGGSSPRMRGTRCWAYVRSPVWGIIPAYAGNTRTATRRW